MDSGAAIEIGTLIVQSPHGARSCLRTQTSHETLGESQGKTAAVCSD